MMEPLFRFVDRTNTIKMDEILEREIGISSLYHRTFKPTWSIPSGTAIGCQCFSVLIFPATFLRDELYKDLVSAVSYADNNIDCRRYIELASKWWAKMMNEVSFYSLSIQIPRFNTWKVGITRFFRKTIHVWYHELRIFVRCWKESKNI